jgi:hypothetical protein
MDSEKELTIWHVGGHADHFINVTNVEVTTYSLSFDYFGQSTQKHRRASFYIDSLAGWAFDN